MIFATAKLNPRLFVHMLKKQHLIPAKLNELTVCVQIAIGVVFESSEPRTYPHMYMYLGQSGSVDDWVAKRPDEIEQLRNVARQNEVLPHL